MKIGKMILLPVLGLLLVFGAASLGTAQSVQSVYPTNLNIHEFLVSDLGLTGGGRDYELFRVAFASNATATSYKLFIEIETFEGDKLLNGQTEA